MEEVTKITEDIEEGRLTQGSIGPIDRVEITLRDYTVLDILVIPDDETCKEQVSIGVEGLRDFIEILQTAQVKVDKLIEIREEEKKGG